LCLKKHNPVDHNLIIFIMKKLIILLSILLSFLNIIYCQNMIIEWQNCFGGSKDDHATDIIKLEDGFLIAGSTTSNDGDISYLHGGQDWWLVKQMLQVI